MFAAPSLVGRAALSESITTLRARVSPHVAFTDSLSLVLARAAPHVQRRRCRAGWPRAGVRRQSVSLSRPVTSQSVGAGCAGGLIGVAFRLALRGAPERRARRALSGPESANLVLVVS